MANCTIFSNILATVTALNFGNFSGVRADSAFHRARKRVRLVVDIAHRRLNFRVRQNLLHDGDIDPGGDHP